MKRYIILGLTICMGLVASCSKNSSNDSIASPGPGAGGVTGKGGSMARFSIADDHMFIINDKDSRTSDNVNLVKSILSIMNPCN